MRVPEWENRASRPTVTVSTPRELRPPPEAFGTDVAEALQNLGETGQKIGQIIAEHGLKIAQEKQDMEVLQRETTFLRHLDNLAYNDTLETIKIAGQDVQRPKGFLSRQLGKADGITAEFSQLYYKQLRNQYLSGLSAYQIDKLAPKLDSAFQSLSHNLSTYETQQYRENFKNITESNSALKILNASTIRDPESLGLAIDDAIESARPYNSMFDEVTKKLKESRIAEDMISSAVDNLFLSTKDFKQADALLFQVKDKISSQAYNEKRNELFIKAKKAKKETELAIIEAKNAREDELFTSHILHRNITKQFLLSELEMEKISPEFVKSMINDIESLKRIDAKTNSSTFNKLVDYILAENKPEEIRIELLKENAKGEITDDELKILNTFNQVITKDTLEKALPKKSFLQWISGWSDEYAQKRPEIKAQMFKEYIQKVSAGIDPEMAVNEIIRKRTQEILVNKTPSMANLSKGKGQLMTDAQGNRAIVYPDGTIEEINK